MPGNSWSRAFAREKSIKGGDKRFCMEGPRGVDALFKKKKDKEKQNNNQKVTQGCLQKK